jgi:hypothetical protein
MPEKLRPPGRILGPGRMMGKMVVVMVVPIGPRRGFRSGTTGESSCGEKDDRRTRLGGFTQRLLVQFQHYISPSI